MSSSRFTILFIILLTIQLFLSQYCRIGPYIYICLFPAMIFCEPTSRPAWVIMCSAFVSGLVVDILIDGVIGLNAASLVLVAATQKFVIRKALDEDIVERHYSFSFRENGFIKVSLAMLIEFALFFCCYFVLDSAGTRSFSFILTQIVCSTLISFIFGLPVVNLLAPRHKR